MALVAILVFAVNLGWLPSSGAYDIGKSEDVPNRILHLILPLSVVVVQHVWYYAYMVRNRILEEMRADYVLLAKAKGLTKGRVVFRHCLRSAIPSYLSLMAISVPHILGGTYIVEMVFSYPGLGQAAVAAGLGGDMPLLLGITVITAAIVFGGNLAADLLYGVIDPRIRRGAARK